MKSVKHIAEQFNFNFMEEKKEQRYELVKSESKGDQPPEYMRDVTMAGIRAYYFNWHAHDTHATDEQIALWYKKARGWSWQPL